MMLLAEEDVNKTNYRVLSDSKLYLELLLIIIYKICKEVLLHYKQQIILNMREVGFEPTNP
jgi:hypothetical protein